MGKMRCSTANSESCDAKNGLQKSAKLTHTVTPSRAKCLTCRRRARALLRRGSCTAYRTKKKASQGVRLLQGQAYLCCPPLPAQAAAEQVRKECRRKVQAHLFVAEGGTEEHTPDDMARAGDSSSSRSLRSIDVREDEAFAQNGQQGGICTLAHRPGLPPSPS